MFKTNKKHCKKISFNRGFTALELTIVISIFAILSSIILFDSNAFNSKIASENLAHDIAINILQTQKEAVSGKINSLPFGNLPPSYGIYFDSSNNQKFTYFADLFASRDVKYTTGGLSCASTPECLREISIQSRDTISDLCVNQRSSPPGVCGLSDLSIVFARPLPKPYISSTDPTLSSVTPIDADIVVTSPKTGESHTITVWRTGEISVK